MAVRGRVITAVIFVAVVVSSPIPRSGGEQPSGAKSEAAADFLAGRFRWRLSQPLVTPFQRPGDTLYSVKDPSIVYYGGRWHLFCTIRGQNRSHQVEYITFADWKETDKAKRYLLKMHPNSTAGFVSSWNDVG